MYGTLAGMKNRGCCGEVAIVGRRLLVEVQLGSTAKWNPTCHKHLVGLTRFLAKKMTNIEFSFGPK